MTEQDTIRFLSYEQALALVGAIQEEEDIHRVNKRILTVYSTDNRELCWFDYDEILADLGSVPKAELKAAVQDYILHHLPEWAQES